MLVFIHDCYALKLIIHALKLILDCHKTQKVVVVWNKICSLSL